MMELFYTNEIKLYTKAESKIQHVSASGLQCVGVMHVKIKASPYAVQTR